MMKRNRLIFYSVIGGLHILLFLFTIYMDGQKNNVQFLFSLQKQIGTLPYFSFILMILFGTNVILHYRDNRRHIKEKQQLEDDLNNLKAKLYDLQDKK